MTFRKETIAEGVDDRWVTIYALCEPIERWTTGEVRYIGKTVETPSRRVMWHCYAAKRTPKLPVSFWLRKHLDLGNPLHIKHLERIPPGKDWADRERHWIAKYRAEGARLLNLTDGGEGLAGLRMTPEHRAKIAAANSAGSNFDCEVCGKTFWRKPYAISRGENRFCSRVCSNRRHL